MVGVALERNVLGTECAHQRLKQRRSVGGVPAGERGNAWLKRDLGGVDPADVLDTEFGVFFGSLALTHWLVPVQQPFLQSLSCRSEFLAKMLVTAICVLLSNE